MKELTSTERAELETFGAALADKLEAEGPDPANAIAVEDLPPALALEHAAIRRAISLYRLDREMQALVDRARAEGLSWHKIALPLNMTAEGARRKYAHAGG